MNGRESVTHSPNGRIINQPVSVNVANLLLRVVDASDFTKVWNERMPVREMAKYFQITESNVYFLRDYWEMPERVKPPATKAIDVDHLTERLWEKIEERVEKKIRLIIEEVFGQKE